MLDLHCHLLPAVDDGPQSLEDALDLARLLIARGTTHVVCTPHCHRALRLMRSEIVPRVQQLQQELNAAHLDLQVLPGSEVQLWDVEWVRANYEAGELCLLGDNRRFMLVEFSWRPEQFPGGRGAPEFMRYLLDNGTQPIIAHPERHSFLRDHTERVAKLVEAGAWLQLTVGSLTGVFGDEAEQAAHDFLYAFDPIVLASDSHGLGRCTGVEEGLQIISEHHSPERAADIRNRLNNIEELLADSG
jgi:protein-tyrosine phosphatase